MNGSTWLSDFFGSIDKVKGYHIKSHHISFCILSGTGLRFPECMTDMVGVTGQND